MFYITKKEVHWQSCDKTIMNYISVKVSETFTGGGGDDDNECDPCCVYNIP